MPFMLLCYIKLALYSKFTYYMQITNITLLMCPYSQIKLCNVLMLSKSIAQAIQIIIIIPCLMVIHDQGMY